MWRVGLWRIGGFFRPGLYCCYYARQKRRDVVAPLARGFEDPSSVGLLLVGCLITSASILHLLPARSES